MSDGPTVLVSHRIFGDGTDPLAAEIRERLPGVDLRVGTDEVTTRAHAPDAEVVVTGRPGEDPFGPDLGWVQVVSAGVDGLDLDRFRAADVRLTNASGVHAQPIGEQVLGYLLHFERRFDRAVAQQGRREWNRYGAAELADRTVAVVGVGAIGTRVAELCGAVGSTVLGVKRDPSTAPGGVECVAPDGLDGVLERAEYVVLACPLTEETAGLIDADALSRLGERGVVVNVARGEIVDEPALVEALAAGTIRGAALDVFETEPLPEDSPLWGFENVLLTPHVAGSTPHYWERVAELFAENYRRYVAGEELENRIV